jgi:hypothetical protein
MPFNYRGEWDNYALYNLHDAVTLDGSLWWLPETGGWTVGGAPPGYNWQLLVSKGDTGPQGPQGNEGPQGEKGDTGDTGPQGIQGAQGNAGPQGVQGAKGDTGDTGLQGIQGIQGNTGPQGATGPQGIQGPKGDTGDAGPQGIQGATGEAGPQGPSGNFETLVEVTVNDYSVPYGNYLLVVLYPAIIRLPQITSGQISVTVVNKSDGYVEIDGFEDELVAGSPSLILSRRNSAAQLRPSSSQGWITT